MPNWAKIEFEIHPCYFEHMLIISTQTWVQQTILPEGFVAQMPEEGGEVAGSSFAIRQSSFYKQPSSKEFKSNALSVLMSDW